VRSLQETRGGKNEKGLAKFGRVAKTKTLSAQMETGGETGRKEKSRPSWHSRASDERVKSPRHHSYWTDTGGLIKWEREKGETFGTESERYEGTRREAHSGDGRRGSFNPEYFSLEPTGGFMQSLHGPPWRARKVLMKPRGGRGRNVFPVADDRLNCAVGKGRLKPGGGTITPQRKTLHQSNSSEQGRRLGRSQSNV